MRTTAAITLGFLSGVMLFLLTVMLADYRTSAGAPTPPLAYVALVAGGVISAYLLRRNAAGTAAVLLRGFLLGAAEWLAFLPLIHANPADYRDVPNAVPVVVGEIFLRILAMTMAAACALAFLATWFITRSKTRKNPL